MHATRVLQADNKDLAPNMCFWFTAFWSDGKPSQNAMGRAPKDATPILAV
jgi:hypothetical protein